jgi:hypothetical protein
MTTEFTALHSTDSATTEVVESGALVGNPRRTRGLDGSVLRPRPATSDLVGNPRRTRHLDIAVIDAA